MLRVALINMPFATVAVPSLGLTQLKSILSRTMGDQVEVRIFYLNQDFARFLGLEGYGFFSDSMEALVAGLGEWFFRPLAFPDAVDRDPTYRTRYLSEPARKRAWEEHGLEEKRRGADAFLDQLIDRYRLDQFPVVGFTSMFQQNLASFALARKLKARQPQLPLIPPRSPLMTRGDAPAHPQVVTAIGGANCETPMGEVIAEHVEAIDFVFSGTALVSFPELLRHTLHGEPERRHQIRGVFSRRKLAPGDRRCRNEAAGEIGEELDVDRDLPLDYEDFLAQIADKLPSVRPRLLFETSRGCWWGERSHCTFCGLNGLTLRHRAMRPENALRQFARLFAYSPGVERFEAADNIMPREYLTTVLPHLKTPPGVSIFYEVRADLKDHEMAVLARAGVRDVQPGIEALATPTLKRMQKGTTAFHNLAFLKSCVRHGVRPGWNLLVGFPGEDEASYRQHVAQLPSLLHLPPPTGVYPVRFDRFSPYFRSAQDYGLKLRPYDFYALLYPFPAAAIDDLAYYFADTNYRSPYLAVMVRWIERLREEVRHWQSRWHRRDGKLKPELVAQATDGTARIYDSRSGVAIEEELSATTRRLLAVLNRPMKPPRIAARMGLTEAELEPELAALRERRLVYWEDETYLSLVLEPVAESPDDPVPGRAGDPDQVPSA